MSQAAEIKGILSHLSRELRELDLGDRVRQAAIERVPPLVFLRDYVSSNKPVVITGAIDHWPALHRWNSASLAAAAGDALATVAVTPDGLADAPTQLADGTPAFALPMQQHMTLAEFFCLLRRSQRGGEGHNVPYLQYQNSSLTAELPQLLADVDPELPWASEAFGVPPDAVNIWMGGQRSATTWHHDHYENLYAVVKGYKVFTLLPPTDAFRLRLQRYPLATYQPVTVPGDGGDAAAAAEQPLQAVLHKPREEVVWSSILPKPLGSRSGAGTADAATCGSPDAADGCSLLEDALLPPPLVVTVGPGEVLYLPACWWHQVQQHGAPATQHAASQADHPSGEVEDEGKLPAASAAAADGQINVDDEDLGLVVAVNYWYDMRYDARYAFGKASEALAVAAGLNEAPPALQ